MYESYFGLREKPFSLTPDPRYFYRSQCHANALELVQHGSRTPGGLTVVTGTSGTGKTTTCRTILESLDRRTVHLARSQPVRVGRRPAAADSSGLWRDLT